ncbi:hypothetical protein GCM10028828_05710 [Corynebacterium tapiri]
MAARDVVDKHLQSLELVVVEAVDILVALQGLGEELHSPQRIRLCTVFDLGECDQEAPLVRADMFDGEATFATGLPAVKNLAYGKADVWFIGGRLNGYLTPDAVRLDYPANHQLHGNNHR